MLVYFAAILIIIIIPVFCKRPHILFFLADDLGWNDIGFHNDEVHTPTLDHYANNGVKLDNYYVQPLCTPSRTQLLTGRYQIHTGMQHDLILHFTRHALPLQFPTLADTLKDCGYRTHLVGKWDLGFYKKEHWPNSRGFDSFYGLLGGAIDYYSHTYCMNEDICGIFCTFHVDRLDFYNNFEPVLDKNGSYATEVYADRVVEVVKEHSERDSDKPIFMFMSFQSPHTPLQVPDEYLQYYGHIQDANRKTYLGMVSAMDAAVKKIVDAFKDNGLWEDTLTIFSTDNGGADYAAASNAPLKGGRLSLWEGGVKAVGFVHGHMISPQIKSTSELLHVSDWFPTLLNKAGCRYEREDLDGKDIWKAISGAGPSSRKELLHNIDPLAPPKGHCSRCENFDTRVRAGLRIGPWKLLTGDPNASAYQFRVEELKSLNVTIDVILPDLSDSGNKNVWLYNLDDDPSECEDLSEVLPDWVEYMCDRLACYNNSAVPALEKVFDEQSLPARHGGRWTYWLE